MCIRNTTHIVHILYAHPHHFMRSSSGSAGYSSPSIGGAFAVSRREVCRAIRPESARRYWSRSLSPSRTLNRSPDIRSWVSWISPEVRDNNFFLSNIGVSGPDEVSGHASASEQVHLWLLSAICKEVIHILYGSMCIMICCLRSGDDTGTKVRHSYQIRYTRMSP